MIVGKFSFSNINDEKNKEILKNYLRGRDVLFVGIGTMKAYLDSCGPRICSKLEKDGINVYGTEDNQMHALNIEEKVKKLKTDDNFKNKFTIAIDSCIGSKESVGSIVIDDDGIKPGAGMQKDLPRTGDLAIKIIISDSIYDIIYYNAENKNNNLDEILKRMNDAVDSTYNFIKNCLDELENETNEFELL